LELARLRRLAAAVPLALAARRMKRSLVGVCLIIKALGGVRRLALESGLLETGQLTKLLRKRSRSTLMKWRRQGLPCVHLGGGDWRSGKPASNTQTFYRLTDVQAFLRDRSNLLYTLHPSARRLLRLELPDQSNPDKEAA
jgi:hypothetical protein